MVTFQDSSTILLLRFFTCWSEAFTLLYFVYIMYTNPFTVNLPQKAMIFEHAVLLCQLIVILVYWAVLVPFLGIGSAPQQKYFAIYLHTFPFICKQLFISAIYNEFQMTKGCYSQKGIGVFFIAISTYYVFNTSLELFFGIIVYPTKLSSGFSLENFVSVGAVFTFMYIFGFALLKLKTKHFKFN